MAHLKALLTLSIVLLSLQGAADETFSEDNIRPLFIDGEAIHGQPA